jgi:predicted metal-dependent HD superfamily phosphohydrolase
MPVPIFETSWARCWPALGAAGDGAALRDRLLAAYAEPQRHYHTQQHLGECLALCERHLALAEHAAEVEIALWFHDAVYDVRGRDNEARSAAWARQALQAAGVGSAVIDRVEALIMATRHQALPQGMDQQLLVDIDLAILGAPRARFQAYEVQVRAEYAWVPRWVFRRKRREVLREFLAREPIYSRPELRAELEAQARDNLAHSIRQLAFWKVF